MSYDTYIVEGGVGKCIMFSALMDKLIEKTSKDQIQVVTPYVYVFGGNPGVKMVFDESSIDMGHPDIQNSSNIYYAEPYKSNYIIGDDHLIKSYCKAFGVDFDPSMRPKMYTDSFKDAKEEWLKSKNITGDYILVQFTGGQPSLGFNQNNQYVSTNAGRNYPPYFAQQIINALKETYPDTTIIDVTLPNEPGYANSIKCDQLYPVIHELLKDAKGFIGIDSYLQHMSASTLTPGVVIWGNTRWTQLGWTHNKNMSFHDKNKYNTHYKMDVNDPRNIMVDPQEVFNTYVNSVHGKAVKEEDVRMPVK